MKIRTISIGLGAIGSEVARSISLREGTEIVGAVDIDKGKAGRDLGEIISCGSFNSLPTSSSLSRDSGGNKGGDGCYFYL